MYGSAGFLYAPMFRTLVTTRRTGVKQLRYTMSFNTPAFLGNAEQNAQWRTPPIKALLRQWWRVVYAADKNFPVRVDEMRSEEGLLFGHAWLENDRNANREKVAARKSLVRIRLDRWDEGKLLQRDWKTLGEVKHPEVQRAIASDLYLGYGPVTPPSSGKPTLKAHAAIQAGESATLSIAVPNEQATHIESALWLMDHFGTIGGRSRNGWGSFSLTPRDLTPPLSGTLTLRNWEEALHADWPHAVGKDQDGALIWQTAAHQDWQSLMKTLAILKIGLRTQFHFTYGNRATTPEDRHWLSYPVTRHSVESWDKNARLPNTLRFKVRKTENGQLVGVIFHVPHLPPAAFNPVRQAIQGVWQKVHTFLDAPSQQLTRIPE